MSRNTAYKDANFRKNITHLQQQGGGKVPATCYVYESKSKVYDIIVLDDTKKFMCRVNFRRSDPKFAHREIDKFFNLALGGI